MKLAGITLTLMIAFGGQTAMANTVKCSMTKFSGAKEDIVVSWIGTRFVLDLKSKKAQMGNEKGWWKPIEITKIQKNKKFDFNCFAASERTHKKIEVLILPI